MKFKVIFGVFAIFLVSLVCMGLVSGQTAKSGVFAGDVFDYDYKIIWASTDPSASVPSSYVDLNNTDSLQIRVDRVSGTVLDLQVTYIFKNGSHTSETGQVDINKEISDVSFGFFFVRANVSSGELIYPAGTGGATMNDTATRTYASGQRETNHFTTQSGSPDNMQEINIYYDKIRGVAVEYTNEISETTNSLTTTTIESLTLANPDELTIPELPTIIALIVVVVASVAILAIKKKHQTNH
jgi:hypothetical protein